MKLDFSRPGKPTDNAFIESFNGRLPQECLHQHGFLSLDDAQPHIDSWRTDYNHQRPHRALGGQAPSEYAKGSRKASESRAQQIGKSIGTQNGDAIPTKKLSQLALQVDQTWGQGHPAWILSLPLVQF